MELHPVERGLHVFWLLGPLILLIERSPADLWLTLLALAFVFRSLICRDGGWLKEFWVRAAFVFWAACLLASAMSSDPLYSLGEATVWFRFPLFAMASAFWLGRDKRILYMMLITTTLGLLLMCGILLAEVLIEGQKGGRLEWPYGDKVSGNYLAKVGLPVFTIMVALAVSIKGRLAAVCGLLSLITLLFSLMTGERINFLIRACGGMLAGLIWKPKWRRYTVLVLVEILAVVIVFHAAPKTGERFVNNFVSQMKINDNSDYYRAMAPGVMAFQQAPIFGIGTANLRNLCPEVIGQKLDGDIEDNLFETLECQPHPHNYYLQIAGETGLVGLITGVVFLTSIVWTCFKASIGKRENVVLATAWVIPFGLFWPVTSTADFFGQWNNIFMWSAVALALAATNLRDRVSIGR